jgi:hypothetical protein
MLNWDAIVTEASLLKTQHLLGSMLIAFLVVRFWAPGYLRRLRAPLMVTMNPANHKLGGDATSPTTMRPGPV